MRGLQARLRLLEIGVFLPVLVTGVFAVAYVKAVRARQQAVEAAARQLARRVLESTVAEARARGDRAAQAILDPLRKMDGADPGRVLASMRAATDSLRICRCGPIKEGAYSFYWQPATGRFESDPVVPGRIDPRRRLRELSPPDVDGPRSIWAGGGVDSAGPWLLHYLWLPVPGGAPAVAGFDISMASWWADTFTPAVATQARVFFPMVGDPDTVLAAFLTARGNAVAGDSARYKGPTVSTDVLGESVFGLGLTLNPAVLPVVLAAASPPSYPLLIGALGASLLVSLLALLLLRQVRRTIAQRDAFVAAISHELRTPLTEVLLHAESLQLDRDTPETKSRAAASIVRETRRLVGLVEHALTLAGAGRATQAAVAPVRLAPVVRASLQALEPAVRERRAQLETSLDETAAAAIDPTALDRITTNLVENALRYGPEGQAVRVILEANGAGPRLVVEDQGPGVSDGERDRIFEPFERGVAGERSGSGGVGLGLAIVRHLAHAAGGVIDVGRAPRGGARFVVTLPRTP